MTRWPMRSASRAQIARSGLGDKVHKATLHTLQGRERLVREISDWSELRKEYRQVLLVTSGTAGSSRKVVLDPEEITG